MKRISFLTRTYFLALFVTTFTVQIAIVVLSCPVFRLNRHLLFTPFPVAPGYRPDAFLVCIFTFMLEGILRKKQTKSWDIELLTYAKDNRIFLPFFALSNQLWTVKSYLYLPKNFSMVYSISWTSFCRFSHNKKSINFQAWSFNSLLIESEVKIEAGNGEPKQNQNNHCRRRQQRAWQ